MLNEKTIKEIEDYLRLKGFILDNNLSSNSKHTDYTTLTKPLVEDDSCSCCLFGEIFWYLDNHVFPEFNLSFIYNGTTIIDMSDEIRSRENVEKMVKEILKTVEESFMKVLARTAEFKMTGM